LRYLASVTTLTVKSFRFVIVFTCKLFRFISSEFTPLARALQPHLSVTTHNIIVCTYQVCTVYGERFFHCLIHSKLHQHIWSLVYSQTQHNFLIFPFVKERKMEFRLWKRHNLYLRNRSQCLFSGPPVRSLFETGSETRKGHLPFGGR
jgi:hypothetical protein